MPVKGVAQVQRNVGKWVANIEGAQTEKVLLTIAQNAAIFAKLVTPVDTNALINSLEYKVINNGKTGLVKFNAGFSKSDFNYAYFLHENTSWKPHKKKDATHHFLSSAFEDPAYKADHQRTIINGYKL